MNLYIILSCYTLKFNRKIDTFQNSTMVKMVDETKLFEDCQKVEEEFSMHTEQNIHQNYYEGTGF